MKIYITHSKEFDFKEELYEPIRNSSLNLNNDIILPHEKDDNPFSSLEFISHCDVVIGDVSYPSTGQGIELGWADSKNIPIICIYKEGRKISNSLKMITNNIISYKNCQDMIVKLSEVLNNLP
jgi:hypothetical protein